MSIYFSQMEKRISGETGFFSFCLPTTLTFQFQRTDPVFTEERKFKSNPSTPPCNLSWCQVLVPLKKENILVFENLLVNQNYEIADSELEL